MRKRDGDDDQKGQQRDAQARETRGMPAIENRHSYLDQLWSGGRHYRVGEVRRQPRRVLTVPGSEGCANPSFSDIVRSVTDLGLHEELGQGNSRAARARS